MGQFDRTFLMKMMKFDDETGAASNLELELELELEVASTLSPTWQAAAYISAMQATVRCIHECRIRFRVE